MDIKFKDVLSDKFQGCEFCPDLFDIFISGPKDIRGEWVHLEMI